MKTDAIELICEKLGTTIENLVPAVIEYAKRRASVGLTIGLVFFAVGVVLIAIAFRIDKGDSDVGFGCKLFGFSFLIAGAILCGINSYSKYMFNAMPTISAYKEIFGWLKN